MTEQKTIPAPQGEKIKKPSMFLDILKGTVRSPAAKLGAVLLVLIILLSLLAPVIAPTGRMSRT